MVTRCHTNADHGLTGRKVIETKQSEHLRNRDKPCWFIHVFDDDYDHETCLNCVKMNIL
jgi:hypothetical protein